MPRQPCVLFGFEQQHVPGRRSLRCLSQSLEQCRVCVETILYVALRQKCVDTPCVRSNHMHIGEKNTSISETKLIIHWMYFQNGSDELGIKGQTERRSRTQEPSEPKSMRDTGTTAVICGLKFMVSDNEYPSWQWCRV